MSWARIKAALNSTLGTANFKPLNKIIEDGFQKVSEIQANIKEIAITTLEKLKSGENEYSVKNAVVAQSADVVTKYAFEKIYEGKDEPVDGIRTIRLKGRYGLFLVMHSEEHYIPIKAMRTTFLYVPNISTTSDTEDGIINSSDGDIAYSYETDSIYHKYTDRRIYMIYRLNVKVTEVQNGS